MEYQEIQNIQISTKHRFWNCIGKTRKTKKNFIANLGHLHSKFRKEGIYIHLIVLFFVVERFEDNPGPGHYYDDKNVEVMANQRDRIQPENMKKLIESFKGSMRNSISPSIPSN